MAEPLVKGTNIVSGGLSAGVYMLGYPKIALFMLVLNGLDVVGRQTSADYRAFVNQSQPPIAGLGFVPAIRSIGWR